MAGGIVEFPVFLAAASAAGGSSCSYRLLFSTSGVIPYSYIVSESYNVEKYGILALAKVVCMSP